ncbi:efflux transporter periplasmic adaptor subunit, partial [Bacillus pseudomycoides]|nr:efflux transporter periplasmic adaptor subunit [Bacillus pseudomycoides]
GNIESFYADPTKGKVKDIALKEGQKEEKGAKLFTHDNEEIDVHMKQVEHDQEMTSMRYDVVSKKIDSVKNQIKKEKDNGA